MQALPQRRGNAGKPILPRACGCKVRRGTQSSVISARLQALAELMSLEKLLKVPPVPVTQGLGVLGWNSALTTKNNEWLLNFCQRLPIQPARCLLAHSAQECTSLATVGDELGSEPQSRVVCVTARELHQGCAVK